ncbi:MAG: YaiI/YqxD family protein [Candidatus Obscuribacterales bacterium]|nr:YaiI/YqxD family protein [Candidatus Obscuribacterales bacterium]
MNIWVDADACPVSIKEVIIKAAVRRKVPAVFVANKDTALPQSPLLTAVKVAAGADEADRYIDEQAQPEDLVVTQDILLAQLLVARSVTAIDPRGVVFCEDNINERVSFRALMVDLRSTGDVTGGQKPFNEVDKRNFSNSFDKQLTRLIRLSGHDQQHPL